MTEDNALNEIIADLKELEKDYRMRLLIEVPMENYEAYLKDPVGLPPDQYRISFLCHMIRMLVVARFLSDMDLSFKKELWAVVCKIINYLEVEMFKGD